MYASLYIHIINYTVHIHILCKQKIISDAINVNHDWSFDINVTHFKQFNLNFTAKALSFTDLCNLSYLFVILFCLSHLIFIFYVILALFQVFVNINTVWRRYTSGYQQMEQQENSCQFRTAFQQEFAWLNA